MPSLFDANIPARDIGASVIQVVAGRANPIGGVSVYSVKIGRLPMGAIITAVSTNVETAITGSTPAFSIGTTAGGAEIVTTVALTAGSLNTVPLAALVMPLAADTDIYANITGTATGDAYVMVQFYKFGPT
jgi:hypothetical protein